MARLEVPATPHSPPMNPSLASVAALLFATSAWGSLFLVGKPLLATLDPVWFTTMRYTLATLLLVVLVQAFGRSPWRKLRSHFVRLTLLGLAGYGCFSVLVFFGLARSLPSHGSVIMATMPFTTLLLRWGLNGQRPPRASLLGAAVRLTRRGNCRRRLQPGAAGRCGHAAGRTPSRWQARLAGCCTPAARPRCLTTVPWSTRRSRRSLPGPGWCWGAVGATLWGWVPAPSGVAVAGAAAAAAVHRRGTDRAGCTGLQLRRAPTRLHGRDAVSQRGAGVGAGRSRTAGPSAQRLRAGWLGAGGRGAGVQRLGGCTCRAARPGWRLRSIERRARSLCCAIRCGTMTALTRHRRGTYR